MQLRKPNLRNYEKRIRWFDKEIKRRTNPALRDKLNEGRCRTIVCLQAFLDFSKSVEGYTVDWEAFLRQRVLQLNKSLSDTENLVQESHAILDNPKVEQTHKELTRRLTLNAIEQSRSLHEVQILEFEIVGSALTASIALLPVLLFDHVYGPQPGVLRKEDVYEAIAGGVQWIPVVGQFIGIGLDAVEKAKDFHNRITSPLGEEGESADRYLNYLDTYIDALAKWDLYRSYVVGLLSHLRHLASGPNQMGGGLGGAS